MNQSIYPPLTLNLPPCPTYTRTLSLSLSQAIRIRQVAQSETFGETINQVRQSDGGLAALWDGFPPLLVRQVLFGMMKFLVFDAFGTAVFAAAPSLRENVATSLGVSLVSN